MTTKIPAELSSTPGIVDNSNATAITIDSSENVAIGASSTSTKVTIQAADSDTVNSSANGHLTFYDDAPFGYYKIRIATTNRDLAFDGYDTDNSWKEILKLDRVDQRINSKGGIMFGSDTAAANTLDDYEEGTFTPNLKFGSTDNATTYDRTGQYTKIGNTVYVTIQLGFPNGVTTSDGGIAQISNLPFTSISGARHIGPLSPYGMSGFGNRPVCRVGGGSDILYLNDDHAGNFYVASDFATSAEMFMSITYQGA